VVEMKGRGFSGKARRAPGRERPNRKHKRTGGKIERLKRQISNWRKHSSK